MHGDASPVEEKPLSRMDEHAKLGVALIADIKVALSGA